MLSRSRKLLFLVSLIISFGFIMATDTQKAYAIAENHDNIPINMLYPNGDTGNNDGSSMECTWPEGGVTHGHRQNHWISPSNSPGTTTVNPAPGVNSLLLKMNVLLGTCNSVLSPSDSGGNIVNFSLRNTRFKITSSSVASTSGSLSLSGLTGAEVTNPTDLMHFFNARFAKKNEGGQNIPYYSLFFLNGLKTLSPGRNTITINAEARVINEYVGGVFRCVGGPIPGGGFPTSLNDTRCPTSPTDFVFYVDIPAVDNPTTLTIDGDCSKISGVVEDLDIPSSSSYVLVDVKVDDNNVALGHRATKVSKGKYKWEFDIADRKDLTQHTWSISFTNNKGKYITKTKKIGPCAKLTCDSISVSGGVIEPGKKFKITVVGGLSDYGSKFSAVNATYNMRVVRGNSNPANPTVIPIESPLVVIDGKSSTYTQIFDDFGRDYSLPSPGLYTVRVTIVAPAGLAGVKSECNTPIDVSWVPYMKFYGNDIYAGAAFRAMDKICKIPKSNIKGDSIISDAGFPVARGSSVEYGSFATGSTDGLFTDGLRINSGLPSKHAAGLGFGNFNPTPKQLRGDYAGDRCLEDFNNIVPKGVTVVKSSGGNLSTLINEAGVTGDVYVIVNGNLTIDKNIFLADFSGIDEIPNLVVIVNGDITISKSVSDVQGVYIAQPKKVGMDIEGGTVHTCGGLDPRFLAAQCASQLRFKGALVAKHVDFYRSFGLLDKDSFTNESVTSNTISESYEFLPEIYVRQTVNTDKADIDVKYDFITSLPPVL